MSHSFPGVRRSGVSERKVVCSVSAHDVEGSVRLRHRGGLWHGRRGRRSRLEAGRLVVILGSLGRLIGLLHGRTVSPSLGVGALLRVTLRASYAL